MSRGTRTRQATHGTAVVSHAQCPECRGRHVVAHKLLGIVKWLCAACGHLWQPSAEERAPR